MLGVLAGFFVVWSIILVGMFVGRRNILGENARNVLSALTFFVASPALLFETLSKAKLHDVFAAPLLVTAVGALTTAALFFGIVRFVLKRPVPEALISSMSASLANSANLGIPIAVFVLGDASYVAPLLIFQLAFFTPLFLMALDATTSSHRTTPLSFVLMILRNPMIVGSALGLVVAGTGFQVPPLLLEPIHLIGGAAIPAMLIAFGMSLNGSKPLQAAAGRRRTPCWRASSSSSSTRWWRTCLPALPSACRSRHCSLPSSRLRCPPPKTSLSRPAVTARASQ